MEKFESIEKIHSTEFITANVKNLEEASEKIFDELKFDKEDIVLIDNDETIHDTLKNFLLFRNPMENMPKDSQYFLKLCEDRGVNKAIITNMPRIGHYMNHNTPVFGYEHYFKSKIMRSFEFPLTLCLGSLYKETNRSIYEIASWSMYKRGQGGRVAFVGNSLLDKGFAVRLNKVLKEWGYNENLYFLKLPTFRSFRI